MRQLKANLGLDELDESEGTRTLECKKCGRLYRQVKRRISWHTVKVEKQGDRRASRTEPEVGDCFKHNSEHGKEYWAYRILTVMGNGYVYVEELHLRTDPYLDVRYAEKNGAHEVPSHVSLEMVPRKEFDVATESRQISNSDYDILRGHILQLLGLSAPEKPQKPLFKNTMAAQAFANAQEGIRLAIELERGSS